MSGLCLGPHILVEGLNLALYPSPLFKDQCILLVLGRSNLTNCPCFRGGEKGARF
jgi:hypothetical protein